MSSIYVYIYLIYSEADSDHTKYLVEPQVREGVSGQTVQTDYSSEANWLIMKEYQKREKQIKPGKHPSYLETHQWTFLHTCTCMCKVYCETDIA